MAITYEQFVKVLPNDFARRTMGLEMSRSQLEFLLADEAHTIAFYDEWTRRGQPRATEVKPTRAPTPAASSPAPPEASELPAQPFAPGSTATIVIAISLFFLAGAVIWGLLLAIAGTATGAITLAAVEWSERRGRKAAIVATIVCGLFGIYSFILTLIWADTGRFLFGAW